MTVRILEGDCRDVLRTLPDESVHCVVTSPPYFGLRDYGTAEWGGGDANCGHVVGAIRTGGGMEALSEQYRGGGRKAAEPKPMTAKDVCPRCGAIRVDRQMGLEATPDDFIAGMVAVFRECRRVLRSDGTLWLNIGDSYSGSWGAQSRGDDRPGGLQGSSPLSARQIEAANRGRRQTGTIRAAGVKPKDLYGIPWMLAFALRADGWFLRQDIIWSKPNPMPESIRDRCTKAHEYLFLLSKSPRYYYDADAIAEHLAPASVERLSQPGLAEQRGSDRVPGKTNGAMKSVSRYSFARTTKESSGEHGQKAQHRPDREDIEYSGRRNKRSVWSIATVPNKEDHFAMMPPALAEQCIRAGCPPGGVVLDPFGGAGTTGLVADRLQRDAILIELNPKNVAIPRRRIAGDAPLLAEVATA